MNNTDDGPTVSARRLRGHIEAFERIGPRPDGTAANLAAADYVATGLTALGLTVERHPLALPVLDDVEARIRVVRPYPFEVTCVAHLRTGLTSEGGIFAPLRAAGKLLPRDLHQVDLEGAVALGFEDMPFEGETRDAICYFGERVRLAHQRGAVGVIFAEYRADSLITTWGIGRGLAPIPCVAISYPEFDRLRHLATTEDVGVQLVVDGTRRDGSSDGLSAFWSGSGSATRSAVAIVGTHTDSVPTCTGANDNGSGLAMVLEVARVLTAGHPETPALYVVTSGEEAGSLGATAYGRENADWLGANICAAIAFDQIGGTEAFLSGQGDPGLNARLAGTAEALGYLLRRDDEPDPPLRTGLADVRPFADLGIPSAYIGGWTQDPVYHTASDTMRFVSPNALKALGDVVVSTCIDLTRGPAKAARGESRTA